MTNSAYAAGDDTALLKAIEDLYEDLGRNDADWAPDTVAEDDAALVIGSDPDEWWQGHRAICEAWSAAKQAYGGTALTPTRLELNRHGDVAWVTDEPRYSVGPDDSQGTLRLTLILVLRLGVWRLIHLHASAAIANSSLLDQHQ
jgi:ketosteroid isomerase-like protein